MSRQQLFRRFLSLPEGAQHRDSYKYSSLPTMDQPETNALQSSPPSNPATVESGLGNSSHYGPNEYGPNVEVDSGDVRGYKSRRKRCFTTVHLCVAVLFSIHVISLGLMVNIIIQGVSSDKMSPSENTGIEEGKTMARKSNDSSWNDRNQNQPDVVKNCEAKIKYTKEMSKKLYNSDECEREPEKFSDDGSVQCHADGRYIKKKCLCSKQLQVCQTKDLNQYECGQNNVYDCAGADNPCQNGGVLERCDVSPCQKMSLCAGEQLVLSDIRCNCDDTDFTGDFCQLPRKLQCSTCEAGKCDTMPYCNSTRVYPCIHTENMTKLNCTNKIDRDNLPPCGMSATTTSATRVPVTNSTPKVPMKTVTNSQRSNDTVTKTELTTHTEFDPVMVVTYSCTLIFLLITCVPYIMKCCECCRNNRLPKQCPRHIYMYVWRFIVAAIFIAACFCNGILMINKNPENSHSMETTAFIALMVIQHIGLFILYNKPVKNPPTDGPGTDEAGIPLQSQRDI